MRIRHGNLAFRDRLDSLSVNIEDGVGSTAHVQCEVVPLVVLVIDIGQFQSFRHDSHIGQNCFAQHHAAILEPHRHAIGKIQQFLIIIIPFGTEPQFHGEVVCRSWHEGGHVDFHAIRAIEMGSEVLVVDIPTLRRHDHVARTYPVDKGRAVTFVHAPVADETRSVVGFQLVALLIHLQDRLLGVPDGEVAHHAFHAIAADLQLSFSRRHHDGMVFHDVGRGFHVGIDVDGADEAPALVFRVKLQAHGDVVPDVGRQYGIRLEDVIPLTYSCRDLAVLPGV